MNAKAEWYINLMCDCPACDEYVDLLEFGEFWLEKNLVPGETKTNLQVTCPECGAIFLVDTQPL